MFDEVENRRIARPAGDLCPLLGPRVLTVCPSWWTAQSVLVPIRVILRSSLLAIAAGAS